MKNLIIDATKEEVFFSVITDSQSYTTTYINSRENFDKFIELLLIFLKKYKIQLKDIEKIFVNQGPGKLSSIRTSISIAKAIALSKNISLFGFDSNDFDGNFELGRSRNLLIPRFRNANIIPKGLYLQAS